MTEEKTDNQEKAEQQKAEPSFKIDPQKELAVGRKVLPKALRFTLLAIAVLVIVKVIFDLTA